MDLNVLEGAGAGVAEDVGVDRHAAGALHVAPEDKRKEKVVYQGQSCEILDGIRRGKGQRGKKGQKRLKILKVDFF